MADTEEWLRIERDEAIKNEHELIDLLLDVWLQFSTEAVVGGERVRNDGGLSVLGDVFRVLIKADRITADGYMRDNADG